jgi:hypothetical protein
MSERPNLPTQRSQRSPSQPFYEYHAYGLSIRSDLALPELEAEPTERPDLVVQLRSVGRPFPSPAQGPVCEYGADEQYLAWPNVGAFLIRGHNRIDIEPAPGVSMPYLSFPLLGPVISLLLHIRGMLVLHASAIAVGGSSAIFLGPKGAGKSTTAAAFVAAGHRLLTDDVLGIDFSNSDNPQIVPGFPQLKLSTEAAERILLDTALTIPPPLPNFPKLQRRLTTPFLRSRAPLNRIYVLARGPFAAKHLLSASDALVAIMSFSFPFLNRQRALSHQEAAKHLKQCATLVGTVSTFKLEVPSDLDRLNETVKLVEGDLS